MCVFVCARNKDTQNTSSYIGNLQYLHESLTTKKSKLHRKET